MKCILSTNTKSSKKHMAHAHTQAQIQRHARTTTTTTNAVYLWGSRCCYSDRGTHTCMYVCACVHSLLLYAWTTLPLPPPPPPTKYMALTFVSFTVCVYEWVPVPCICVTKTKTAAVDNTIEKHVVSLIWTDFLFINFLIGKYKALIPLKQEFCLNF